MNPKTKDGTLVFSATGSVGFHLLSALLRLERNCKGLSSFESPKELLPDCPVIHYNFFSTQGSWPLKENDLGSAVFILEDQLHKNSRPSQNLLDAYLLFSRELIQIHKNIHLIFVFPLNMAKEEAQKFLDLQPQVTIFVSPPVVGFRDNSLMDLSLKHQKLSVTGLIKNHGFPSDTAFVTSPDVVGFLISAIGQQNVFGKCIRIPDQIRNVQEWAENFKSHFSGKSKPLDLLKEFFLKQSPLVACQPLPSEFDWHQKLPLATDLFPSPLQKIDRFMKSSFENLMRSPQNPKHFPPRRAL